MASSSLLGPPEVYSPRTTIVTAMATSAATGNPFIDLMVDNFNTTTTATPPPPMGYTEKKSPTFLSTGNPCLDAFFHVTPNTPSAILTQRLHKAWEHNPLTALKLVCNLRGVRGTGKSDKEGYYTAALWLHQHHPKTLACNVGPLAEFGYFKDLPEILYRILEGPERIEIEEEKARELREAKKIAAAKKAVEHYSSDPDYKFLHDRISDLFADFLKSDIQHFNSNQLNKISLAAKWCPSLDSSFDRATLLCESIAKKVFPRDLYKEYDGVLDAHYAYRVRDRLRKEILVPLRKALELPEVYIGANKWKSIPYKRVASVAMKFYKEKFIKHDRERFQEYLEKSGKGIAAGALLPHEIIASLNGKDGGEVAKLQWKRMVDDLSKKRKLKNCLAICDFSDSMNGEPMEVSLALGVLISELSEEPWKGKLITFSHNPTLQMVLGDDLRSKTDFVRRMENGKNVDFQKVFDLMLEVAVNGKLAEEHMIKRVFVFSDMEFGQVSARPWETDYQAIVRKFGEKGYGSSVPEIVFWNLRDSRATPVAGNQKGVALVSGFSKNLMTVFLEESGALNPEAVMEVAISGEKYKKLIVLD
ncbi:hypothetical protein RHMOL_Rhmol12G0022500 [Rhododendron molle]|uniref:Uncharacterized protein n=1 Tax=Rhododendron molle TaxID=49168 RepID=A0ACC0LDX3_RHOML|nr:hypothetical protein RHMOL_Rhmol12G0022500 [Rhododendron molle]